MRSFKSCVFDDIAQPAWPCEDKKEALINVNYFLHNSEKDDP